MTGIPLVSGLARFVLKQRATPTHKENMKKILITALVVCAGFIVSGCKGSGSGGGQSPATVGIAVPQQVTAIPPKTSAASFSASTTQSLPSTSAEALTDLQGATTNKYVDEQTLTQTDILKQKFWGPAQT